MGMFDSNQIDIETCLRRLVVKRIKRQWDREKARARVLGKDLDFIEWLEKHGIRKDSQR